MNRNYFIKCSIIIVLTIMIIRTFCAIFFPATLDEAYYFQWSRYLDFGYFDHPPMIAFLSALGHKLDIGIFGFRLMGLALSFTLPIICLSICYKAGIKSYSRILVALVLTCFSLGGLILGFLQTPDLPLIIFWALAIHEAMAAMSEENHRWRWLSAGFFTGLGIQSKYTMLLIGPVFLLALIKSPSGLKQRWPYLGGLVCLLSISPHLIWNANNEWISFRFQMGRGFLSEYEVKADLANRLPKALPGTFTPNEDQLIAPLAFEKKEPSARKGINAKKIIKRVSEFLGGLLLLWGLLLIPLISSTVREFRAYQKSFKERPGLELNSQTKRLLFYATFVPIIIFGLISPFQKIEANWTAMYMVTAAPLLATYLPKISLKWLLIASFANTSLLLGLCWYATQPQLFPFTISRIKKETFGYKQVARYIEKIPNAVFADSYQNVSMLSFYQNNKLIMQWPGITRMSEFIRRPEFAYLDLQDLEKSNGFYIVSDNKSVSYIPGFKAKKIEILEVCADNSHLTTIKAYPYERRSQVQCNGLSSLWILTYYLPEKNSQ